MVLPPGVMRTSGATSRRAAPARTTSTTGRRKKIQAGSYASWTPPTQSFGLPFAQALSVLGDGDLRIERVGGGRLRSQVTPEWITGSDVDGATVLFCSDEHSRSHPEMGPGGRTHFGLPGPRRPTGPYHGYLHIADGESWSTTGLWTCAGW